MVLAIAQARMSSTRLHGKVLKPVLGKPLVQYILERLRLSKRINKIVIATSVARENDPLAELVEKIGFEVFRGNEEDVLDRFYRAAARHHPRVIVRITGDCPLIDPEICDQLIDLYEDNSADYANLAAEFAEGLDCEVFSFASLKTAWRDAKLRSEREHVTLYIKNHPEIFAIKTLANNCDDSAYRITVDNQEDFEVVKAILENYGGDVGISWPRVKDFLNAHPQVMAKNAHIERNAGVKKSFSQDEKIKS